jgi:hypothetical protein
MDALNALADLMTYNYGWVGLLGSASPTHEVVFMLTDKLFSPTSTAVGTVGPYRVDELRSSRLGRLLLKRLSKLIRIVAEQRETAGKRKGETVGELLLRAARYVGQANIDSNRQRSFVSYVIALETVLLPKITTELGYRLATRVATLLTDDPKRWARGLTLLRAQAKRASISACTGRPNSVKSPTRLSASSARKPSSSNESAALETKSFPLRIRENVAFDLSVYCDALGAQWTETINRAVREFIDRELDENPGFMARFERLKRERLEEERKERRATRKSDLLVFDSSPRAAEENERRSGTRRKKP